MNKTAITLAAATALLLCSCTHTPPTSTAAKTEPSLWPRAATPWPDTALAEVRAEAEKLLGQMSLEAKVAQMTQAEAGSVTPDDLRRYPLGSVLVGGGSFLDNVKHANTEAWLTALDAYQLAATSHTPGIPLIWGVDAVHGHNKISGATLFPHNIGLGATHNPSLVRTISDITAKQMRATGMDWTFSPSVSVVRDDRWGRTYESYGEDPQLVAQLGAASIEGYQGVAQDNALLAPRKVVATAKHFIADGGTVDGIDRGDAVMAEPELAALFAEPYRAALAAGSLTVMASHNSWQGERLHGSHHLLTEVLKGDMGFTGFVVGDWNSHALIEGCSNDHCPQAVNAGVDMFMVPTDWRAFIANTVEDVRAGRISEARIDDAVLRILQVKIQAGLLAAPMPSARELAGRTDLLSNDAIKAVARQAVRESAVLLKNNGGLLPLAPNQRVLVTGRGADNIGLQNGGWTLSWQGTDNTNDDFPDATSIYAGIAAALRDQGGTAELSVDGEYADRPDVAVVVFGEAPYAEWMGDVKHLAYTALYPQDLALLEKLQTEDIPVVSVFLSGRPMWVNPELNASDAFIAAWLPGTEGDGIAELLFKNADGKAAYDFTGKLSFSWPATPVQTPLNKGDGDYQPLFPLGYGLSYKSPGELPALPVAFDVAALTTTDEQRFFDGKPVPPWLVLLTADGDEPEPYLSGQARSGALTVIEADMNTQGDSLGARWSGAGAASLNLVSMEHTDVLATWLARDAALVFDARVLANASQPVHLAMGCETQDCDVAVDMTQLINTSPRNTWNSLSVALSCFASEALDPERINRVFSLRTGGSLHLDITNIRIEPGMADKAGVNCD